MRDFSHYHLFMQTVAASPPSTKSEAPQDAVRTASTNHAHSPATADADDQVHASDQMGSGLGSHKSAVPTACDSVPAPLASPVSAGGGVGLQSPGWSGRSVAEEAAMLRGRDAAAPVEVGSWASPQKNHVN